MKRVLSICILVLFLMSLLSAPVFSQSAKEILAKIIEAEGGKKVFENTKDMTLSGTAELVQQGLSGSLVVYKKEPDKRRVDFEVMGMIITQAFDGSTAWGVNPQTGSTEVMSGQQAAEMKREALPLVALLYPKKYGLAFVYKDKEKIDDKDYFVLELTFPDGYKAEIFVDTETYLICKSKAKATNEMGVEVEVEQFMSDFKKVNGMTLAHSITSFRDGEEYLRVTINEVKFNTGLEDSLFKMSE